MIREALQYIVGLSQANIREIGGQVYSDKELNRISYSPKAAKITMRTLTSFVEYLKSGADAMSDKMFVHIQGPAEVTLFSQLDGERCRETLVNVLCDVPDFRYGCYMDHEEFPSPCRRSSCRAMTGTLS